MTAIRRRHLDWSWGQSEVVSREGGAGLAGLQGSGRSGEGEGLREHPSVRLWALLDPDIAPFMPRLGPVLHNLEPTLLFRCSTPPPISASHKAPSRENDRVGLLSHLDDFSSTGDDDDVEAPAVPSASAAAAAAASGPNGASGRGGQQHPWQSRQRVEPAGAAGGGAAGSKDLFVLGSDDEEEAAALRPPLASVPVKGGRSGGGVSTSPTIGSGAGGWGADGSSFSRISSGSGGGGQHPTAARALFPRTSIDSGGGRGGGTGDLAPPRPSGTSWGGGDSRRATTAARESVDLMHAAGSQPIGDLLGAAGEDPVDLMAAAEPALPLSSGSAEADGGWGDFGGTGQQGQSHW